MTERERPRLNALQSMKVVLGRTRHEFFRAFRIQERVTAQEEFGRQVGDQIAAERALRDEVTVFDRQAELGDVPPILGNKGVL